MPFSVFVPRVGGRLLLTLIPLALSALFAATSSAATPATIVIGGRAIPLTVTPFVGDDGEVYAPADVVKLMGASFTVDSRQRSVTVTGASGQLVTVPYIPLSGHECVSLQKISTALGASTTWQPTTTTLTLRARLEMVRQNTDSLSIITSYPVSYQVQHIDNPSRLYVDVYGLDLAAAPAAIPVVDQEGPGANVERIRSGQIDPNTVRITIDLKHDIPFQVGSTTQTSRIRVVLGSAGRSGQTAVAANSPSPRGLISNPLPPLPVASASSSANHPATNVAGVSPTVRPSYAPPASGVRITSVSVKSINDALTQIAVTATGEAKFRTETLSGPNRLAFDLAGASLDAAVNPALPGVGSVITAVRSGILHTGIANFGRVVIDLSRLVAYSVNRQVAADGSVIYLINVQTSHGSAPPPNPGSVAAAPLPVIASGNSLRGKIIVVDPGHGARDSGSLGPDGSMEKTFTLAIGFKLRNALVQNGATVYMTREDDVLPAVMARPHFAVEHAADYFISIHCDSAGGQNSHGGSTVYFHAQNGLCRRMAVDIINRVAEVSGIPANGVKSDTIRFQTGFGVLRGSPMPAVLVECGYMNNDADLAKLKDEATQQNIAEGIVAGLRDFVADRTAR